MKHALPIFLACFAVAACNQAETAVPESEPAASEAAEPSGTASANAAASQEGARKVNVENDLYSFQFSYPAAAGAIPALKAWFEDKIEAQQRLLDQSAREVKEAAAKEGFPYRAFGEWSDWQVVTELPDWLSLSATVGTYPGGAHPNHSFAALLWDKQAGLRRDPVDLFLSKQALSGAVQGEFCRILDQQRARKRGDTVDLSGIDDSFTGCIDPFDGQLILGSSNGQTFNRIGFLVPPYAAGPYAEGDYKITLPVTEPVLSAVKPRYREYFTQMR